VEFEGDGVGRVGEEGVGERKRVREGNGKAVEQRRRVGT
jgi:hypothetical protein